MQITDFITITELSRLTGKSRPTLYKYIEEFEHGKTSGVPALLCDLFGKIAGGCARSEVYRYCEDNFNRRAEERSVSDEEILAYIRSKEDKLDWEKIKKIIDKETK